MEKGVGARVLSNATASVAQAAVSSVLLWVMYRYLVGRMGVDKVGIWSVVVAVTAVARLGDFGIAAGVIRFVAHYASREDHDRVVAVVETAALSVAVFGGSILAALYVLGPSILGRILGGDALRLALGVLPFVLLSLWLSLVAGAYIAALDGLQRVHQRSVAVVSSGAVQLVAVAVLVPVLDVRGLACATVLQALTLTAVARALLGRQLRTLAIVPHRWTPEAFRELLSYGLGFQLISVAGLFYDPITKILLSRFGGLAVTGYYEVASRLLGQVRAFILATSQVLVPVIATLQETHPAGVRTLLKQSQRALAYVAIPVFCLIAGMAPLIGELWLGRYERSFVAAVVIVGAGWLVNILGSPVYFRNLGTGELGPNAWCQLTTGLVNGVLGGVLGWLGGYVGVLAAWALALCAGTTVLLVAQHRRHGLYPIAPRESWPLILVSGAGALLVFKLYYAVRPETTLAAFCAMAAGLLVPTLGVSLWLHPLRGRLLAWIQSGWREEHGTP